MYVVITWTQMENYPFWYGEANEEVDFCFKGLLGIIYGGAAEEMVVEIAKNKYSPVYQIMFSWDRYKFE